MLRKLLIAGLAAITLPLPAALTSDQKASDFLSVAALYAKRYAPGGWKQQLFGTTPTDLKPWLAEVAATTDDLGYLDVLVRYVASFRDTHSNYRVVTNFSASLGFHVDGYLAADGKTVALIDSITRTAVSAARFPAAAGDELVAVDGVATADWVDRFLPYAGSGNLKSQVRLAIGLISSRTQAQLPRLPELGDTALVQVRRQNGALETYELPWIKNGMPLLEIAPPAWSLPTEAAPTEATNNAADAEQVLLAPLRRLLNERDAEPKEILNYGSRTPIWRAPDGFELRLGRATADVFWSGITTHRGKRVGLVRIPNFSPASISVALGQLTTELAFLNQNTDGLVVDVTRNNGGDPCYAENILRLLMDKPWQAFGRLFRIAWEDVLSVQSSLALARQTNSSSAALLEARLLDFQEAYRADRLTPPLSNCALNTDRDAGGIYTKPVLLLTDEFSTSAADYFPAIFQDNQRGPIFGWRTNGAGGSVENYDAGYLSEGGTARVTRTMHYRNRTVSVEGYPSTTFTENVGVQPDIAADMMTVENYRSGGRLWTQGFLDALVNLLAKE